MELHFRNGIFDEISQFNGSLKQLNTFLDIPPICTWCRKIRDNRGFWSKNEAWVTTVPM